MLRHRTRALLVGWVAVGCAVPVDVDGGEDGSGGVGSGTGGSSSGGGPIVSSGGSVATGGRPSTGGVSSTGGAATGGASTGGAATGGAATGGTTTNPDGCTELTAASFDSGSFGSAEARCYSLDSSPPYGWGVYNLNDRTLTINGQATSSGAAMPAGGPPYVFEFTAGSTDTSWSYW